MDIPTKDNHIRFEVILKALDSRDQIVQLDLIDQLNSSINESNLTSLINNASELNTLLANNRFLKDRQLLREADLEEVEKIQNLTVKLEECCEDNLDKFDEAIRLISVIDKLYRKYGHDIPLLHHLHEKSSKQRDKLVTNLCDKLEHLGQDKSVEDRVVHLVNNLIECGNLSTSELKLKYINARDNWFQNICEEKSASFEDVVSVYCHSLPMIFKEYHSIFGEGAQKKLASLKLTAAESSSEHNAIINSWLLMRINVFISSLQVYIKTIDVAGSRPSMISYTMSKCFELTDSLGAIGFDFSSRLKPLFQKAIIEEVKSSIERATIKFETSFTTIAMKSIESLLLPIEDVIFEKFSSPENQNLLRLPKTIENYPVFTIYCLDIVDSMAGLQATKDVLSPICLCLDTYSALNASMTRVMKALAMITNMDNNSSHPILSKIALAFVTEVLPFFVDYCEKLFPERVILNAIGLSKALYKQLCANEPDKVKNFKLDLKQIADPLKMQI